MYTIYQNGNSKGHDLISFEASMIKICNDHKNGRRALAFAFILYDFENPQIWKVLGDNQYWLALNKISGQYLTVFNFNYKEKKRRHESFEIDGFQMLTNIKTKFQPSIASNRLVEKYFGNVSVNYPAILFFQVDNNSVIDSILIDLKEETIEQAFLELKEYISKAVYALKQITPINQQNSKEIFDCLEREIESAHSLRKIKRVFKNAGNVLGLISSIKGLF